MRICLVGPVYPYRGGIAQYTAILGNELNIIGDEVLAISFSRQYPRWLYPGRSDRDPSHQPLSYPAQFLLDPMYPWTWENTFVAIEKWHPDRVVFIWWTTFWGPAYMWLARRLANRGKKNIFLIHNVLPHEKRFFDRFLASATLRNGKGFIVQSSREKENLAQLLPHAQPVYLCSHPIYHQFQKSSLPKEQIERQLGLSAGKPVLLFFGFVRPYKGLRYLIESAAQLKQLGKPVQILVAGEFWEDEKSYLQMIDALDLTGSVIIHNRYIPNEEVGIYFSVADIFVAPYLGGTQSGVIKIAMDFRLPMICTTTIAENEFGTGLRVVPPMDANAITHAVIDLLTNPEPQTANHIPEWQKIIEAIHH
jgi:glycosyltransferase involved in cell wall biosynthesis